MPITGFRKQAAELSKPASKLLSEVMEKYTASILEEVYDQLKARDEELERIRSTVGTAITWLRNEFGDAGCKQLLDMLEPIASRKHP